MRKKYLSALLFGALLLASAGTFTSCKDYDDDINNLQEQINTVKTSLDELTTKVNNLGAGITDFKYENGQLIISTDKGTNFTVDLPASEGIVKLEIKDGVLYADDVAVGNVAGDGGSVVKVEDGKLYIDGKEVAEFGNKVAVADNGNGTYTLTVDGKEYVLPKASASIYSIYLTYRNNGVYEGYFTQDYLTTSDVTAATTIDKFGINWGVAADDVADWTGPKGAVKKGQLLVGAINTLDVTVTPKNADLTQAKLTLVDVNGKEAPVTVTPSVKEADDALTGSRAVATDGTWTLKAVTTATAEEMATAYAGTNENGAAENLKYALAVDGVVMTGYDFVIDTWTAEQSAKYKDQIAAAAEGLKVYLSGVYFGDVNFKDSKIADAFDGSLQLDCVKEIPLGETQLSYHAANIYDVKFEIAPESIDDAELLGVSIDAKTNTLIVSDKAAANTDKKIRINVTAMDVHGVVSKTASFAISSFAETTVDEKQTIATTECTLTTSTADKAKNIIVNMEDVFTSLSAEQSTDLASVAWNGGKLFATDYLKNNVTYYASLDDAKAMKNVININDNTTGSRVRTIKYAVIAIDKDSYVDVFNAAAEAGKYDLNVTLSTSKGEIKKVVAPINIALPAFDSVFTQVDDNLWTAEGRTVRLGGVKTLTLSGIFTSETVESVNTNLKVTSMKYTDAAGNEQDLLSSSNNLGGAITSTSLIDSKKIIDRTLETTVAYTFAAKFTIESSFTVNLKSQFEDAALAYYTDKNTAGTVAEINGEDIIIGNVGTAGAGLALKFNGDEKAMFIGSDNTGLLGTSGSRAAISGIYLNDVADDDAATPNATNIDYTLSVKDCAATTTAAADAKGIKVTGLTSNQTGTLVVTFTDGDGVETTASIQFKKK